MSLALSNFCSTVFGSTVSLPADDDDDDLEEDLDDFDDVDVESVLSVFELCEELSEAATLLLLSSPRNSKNAAMIKMTAPMPAMMNHLALLDPGGGPPGAPGGGPGGAPGGP